MKTIGVTGNIGSGKTTVCKIFEDFGIPVFTADLEAKKLLFVPRIIKKIYKTFGDAVMENGKVVNQKLANVVFSDEKELAKLNTIIHPEIWKLFDKWSKQHKKRHHVIMESALLFESGFYKKLDYIITVTAPVEVRIKRVKFRDKMSTAEVRKRINNQLSDLVKRKGSNFVIVNDGKKPLMPQVTKVYIKLSTTK